MKRPILFGILIFVFIFAYIVMTMDYENDQLRKQNQRLTAALEEKQAFEKTEPTLIEEDLFKVNLN